MRRSIKTFLISVSLILASIAVLLLNSLVENIWLLIISFIFALSGLILGLRNLLGWPEK